MIESSGTPLIAGGTVCEVSWLGLSRALTFYNAFTTLSNGYLGSPIDEERSEMRYVMRIAGLSESSNF